MSRLLVKSDVGFQKVKKCLRSIAKDQIIYPGRYTRVQKRRQFLERLGVFKCHFYFFPFSILWWPVLFLRSTWSSSKGRGEGYNKPIYASAKSVRFAFGESILHSLHSEVVLNFCTIWRRILDIVLKVSGVTEYYSGIS